ncbi:hypothetical protein D3C87_285550 [compost metagenome]
MERKFTKLDPPFLSKTHIESGYESMKSIGALISAIASFVFLIFPVYRKDVYKRKDYGNEFDLENMWYQTKKSRHMVTGFSKILFVISD